MVEQSVKLNALDDLPELKRNYPVFRMIGGNIISFFGDQVYMIAIPLIVLAVTGSALSMGIVSALERLPILLQPVTGILSDRFNRKKLLVLCDLGRAILIGLLGAFFLFNRLEIWMLYLGSLIIGILSQIYNTSQFAQVPRLVRKSDLQAINSINTGLLQTAVLVGPGLGGLIISFYNPGYALLINSFSFLISFLSILSLPIHLTTSENKHNGTFIGDIKEGFRFVFHTKPILFTNLAILVSMFGTTLFLTMIVFHLKEEVQLSAYQIGWLLSLGGMGAIAGALSTNFLIKKVSYRQLLFTSSVLGGLSILLFSYAHSFIWLAFFNAMGTFMATMMNPCILTIRQTLTPDRLLGRVQATSRFMSWIMLPLSAFLAGIIAQYAGTGNTILIGGIISTLASLFYLHPSLKN
jgi:MFS family permease